MNILVDPDARPVVGHRGNRAHAPENTMVSFDQAISAGADAIEFDVRLSADGVPVVHHDPTVGRTTNGTGEVSQMTFAQLRDLDAGTNFTRDNGKTFPYRGQGHKIPSFEEVVDTFSSTALLIEIKDPLAAGPIREVLESRGAGARVLVDAYSDIAVRKFEGSGIAYGASKADVSTLMRRTLLGLSIPETRYRALCVPLSYKGLPLPVRRFAKSGRSRNCRVHVWTINDPAVAVSLWKAGVNGIISDDPALMLKARAGLK